MSSRTLYRIEKPIRDVALEAYGLPVSEAMTSLYVLEAAVEVCLAVGFRYGFEPVAAVR